MIDLPVKFFSSRQGTSIDTIILHYLSAIYYQPSSPFDPKICAQLLDKEEVSYHYMIDRDGQIYKLVDEAQKAWHAGDAKWKGATNINSRSIGIMFLGKEGDRFTPAQYEKGLPFIKEIVDRRAIKEDRLIGHEHIAAGRKVDPGRYFDYLKLYDYCFQRRVETISITSVPKPLSTGKDPFNFLNFIFRKGG